MFQEMLAAGSGGGENVATEYVSTGTSNFTRDVGFTINHLIVCCNFNGRLVTCVYDADVSTIQCVRYDSASTVATIPLNDSSYTGLNVVNGSTFSLSSETATEIRYIATS